MLAGAWWWLSWLMPRLPEKPRHAAWADWLTCAALVLVLCSGVMLIVAMREQPEFILTFSSFKLLIFITLGFRFDWVALTFFVLLCALFLWVEWAALMDSESPPTDVAALRTNRDQLWALGAMTLTLFASDVVVQVLLWHLVPLALCSMMKQDRRAVSGRAAQKRWLIAVSAAGAPFLAGVLILCGRAGAADPALLRPALTSTPSGILLLSGVLMLAGLYIKLGLMPLHRWTSALLRSTPLRARLLLTTALPALDLYLFVRFFFGLYPYWGFQEMSAPLTAFGLLAMVWSVVLAWDGKSDVDADRMSARRLEALHVNQLGFILLGMGVFSLNAIHGSLLHVAVRAVALMALSGLSWASGKGRLLPVASGVHKVAAVIAASALVGVPGTAGFLSAGNIIVGLWQLPSNGAKFLTLFAIAAALGAMAPLLRLLLSAPARRPTRRGGGRLPVSGQDAHATEADGVLNLPWAIACGVLILLGIWTEPLSQLAQLLERALHLRLHF
jgi:formate hydrogenlyase subunit 3/multisubunit Na+/H+ antiporter MnhD subunit